MAGVTFLAKAQTPMIEFTLIVSDGAGGVQELRIGLDPAATDTLDPGIGEEELPPPPPFGIFDARLIDNATGVDGSPTLIWRSVAGAADYRLLVAHDSLSGLNVVDTTIADTLFALPLLKPLSECRWGVAATGVSGEGPFSAAWKFTTMEWLGAGQETIPRELKLEQNYPNPFNPSTTIRYSLPIRSYVTLAVLDALGREIATPANRPEEGGFHEVKCEASRLASGIILCRLNAGVYVQTRRMVLMH